MKKSKNGFISMTLVYTFLILFMFLMLAILRTYNEKNRFLQAVNDQIDSDISSDNKSRVTIINKMLDDNMLQSDKGLFYFKISNSVVGNGNGLFYMDTRPNGNKYNYNLSDITDEDTNGHSSRIYYYRGNVENNHLVFSDMCFRIIRTNEDGSVRLRYNGTYDEENNTCPRVEDVIGGKSVSIGTSSFNSNTSVDYASSPIQAKLEEWYRNNILIKTDASGDEVSKIKSNGEPYSVDVSKSAIYCNNKKLLVEGSSLYQSYEIAPQFINRDDLNSYNDSNIKSIYRFKCENSSTMTNRFVYDNELLRSPVGLLTAQDVALAGGYLLTEEDHCSGQACIYQYKGGEGGTENSNYYLYTGRPYWTMSPYGTGKMIYVNGTANTASLTDDMKYVGAMYGIAPTTSLDIIPVISLNSNVSIAQGTGSYNNPYIVRH